MLNVNELFEAELRRRDIAFTRTDVDAYSIEKGDETSRRISIENLARNFARTPDESLIVTFVDAVLAVGAASDWTSLRDHLRFAAIPSNLDVADGIRDPVSPKVQRALVLTDAEETRIEFVSARRLREWDVSKEQANAAATRNMARLVETVRLELADAGGKKLGLVPLDSPFKASVIFAPTFKRFVAPLGWPVMAVIPARDFIYVFAEAERGLLDQLGAVVQREFRESAYPIATEVLRISDDGITAIGAFPE